MDERRLSRVARQHGLVTTRAALEAGLDDRDIKRLVRHDVWKPLRRGVYADAGLWAACDPWRDRPRLLTRAAHLTVREAHVFSHDSAALEIGLPLLPGAARWTHLTRAGITGSRRRNGVVHHGAPLEPASVVTAHGLPVAALARTAVDLGREHGYAAGLAACDAALRRGATRAELTAIRQRMRNWPGITDAASAIADADPGAETAGETLARIVVNGLGIGPVRTQFPVRLEDGTTAWLDLLVGCHAFEFDGRIKVQSPTAGGVAMASPEQIIWDEKKRERLIRPLGLGISRLVWHDVDGGTTAASRRLLQEYQQTAARFGVRLASHLEEYAARAAPLRARRLAERRAVPPLPLL